MTDFRLLEIRELSFRMKLYVFIPGPPDITSDSSNGPAHLQRFSQLDCTKASARHQNHTLLMPVFATFYLKLLILLILFIPYACAIPVIPDEDRANKGIHATETDLFPGQLVSISGTLLTACGWLEDSLAAKSTKSRKSNVAVALDHTFSASAGRRWNFAILSHPKDVPDKTTSRFQHEWKRLSEVMFDVHALVELMTEAKSHPSLKNTFLNFCSLPSTDLRKLRRLPGPQGEDQQLSPHSNDWARVSDKLVKALIEARSQDPDKPPRSYSDASKEELAFLPLHRRLPAKDSIWVGVAKDSISPGQIVYAKSSFLKRHSRCETSRSSPIVAEYRAFIALDYVSMGHGGRWYFASLLDARNPRYRDLDDRAWVPLSKAMSDIGESDTFEKEDKGSFLLLNNALLALAPDCFLEDGEIIKRVLKPEYIRERDLNGHRAAKQTGQSIIIDKTPDPHSEAWLRVSKELVNALIKTKPRTPVYNKLSPLKRYSVPTSPDEINRLIGLSNPPDLGMENVAPPTLHTGSIQGLRIAPLPKNLPAAIPGRPSPPARKYSGTLMPPQTADS
ncbi:hypothetical protein H0H93_014649 [Arthromyces matolae]|nr:hypothetical protein H0H93_014649 [Arthromyces matolae]